MPAIAMPGEENAWLFWLVPALERGNDQVVRARSHIFCSTRIRHNVASCTYMKSICLECGVKQTPDEAYVTMVPAVQSAA